MKTLLLILISSSIVNNVVLSQFLGICPFFGVSKKVNTAAGMGGAVIFVVTIASFVTSIIHEFILKPMNLDYMNTIVFILVIAALVQFIEMFLKKFIPSLYQALGIYLPLITTNCAVLGSALLNIQNGYNFVYSVAVGFAAAIGFTMAILIFAGVRARLQFAQAPKSFQGMPLVLISAGLIAIAFSGFSGINF